MSAFESGCRLSVVEGWEGTPKDTLEVFETWTDPNDPNILARGAPRREVSYVLCNNDETSIRNIYYYQLESGLV